MQIGFKMTDNNNPSIPNSTVGANTNGGHENGENLNALKLEITTLKVFFKYLL
jgi:hypothetical protein